MTPAEIDSALATCRACLESELPLLHRVHELSVLQRDCSAQNDVEGLSRAGDARERVLAEILSIESRILPTRELLASEPALVSTRPGFGALGDLQRTAANLIVEILAVGERTKELLREAQVAREQLARSLDTGETTLAAYRRVIVPVVPSASLVSSKG